MNPPLLHRLLVCRSMLEDPIVCRLMDYFSCPEDEAAAYEFAAALIQTAEELGLAGNLVASYIVYRLVMDENLAARIMERQGGRIGEALESAFAHDIELLEPLLRESPSKYLPLGLLDKYEPTGGRMVDRHEGAAPLVAMVNHPWTVSSLATAMLDYYRRYGSGDIALYRAFRWEEKKLVGIEHFEPIRLAQLIGYAEQKQALAGNTLAFLSGRPANNVLLVGARGTGKSSSVKALANEFFRQGLRLVQVTRPQMSELPAIMQTLRRFATKRFIIYLDDLSFDDGEAEYKYLKSIIEGGVETRPENVLLYATSNRRHMIKETWREREAGADELYMADSVNETLSLSDRFGLIIDYRLPNQNEYLAIIDYYLRAAGVILTPEELRVAGQRWEMEHSGRNGRTARQFVDYYLGQRKQRD